MYRFYHFAFYCLMHFFDTKKMLFFLQYFVDLYNTLISIKTWSFFQRRYEGGGQEKQIHPDKRLANVLTYIEVINNSYPQGLFLLNE